MKKNSLGILIFLCCISYSFAQTNNNGSISIPDPNTASFTKFIDNPVNTYNGSTDVTIPVYTIENGNIKIPITLRYNTSGIKVSEEAGIVGLGWNLNVGGVITQTINGVFDTEWEYTNLESLEPSLYTPQPQPHWYWEHNYPPQDIYPFEALNSYCPVIHDENWLNSTNLVNFGKGQPDVYYFGFLQYSGKFFIDYRDGSIHIMEKSDKIEFLTYSKNGFEYWKAKTPDGTWFYFEELSHCWTNGTGAVNSISNY